MNEWILFLVVGLPLWLTFLLLLIVLYSLNKKIDNLTTKVNRFIDEDGKVLLREVKEFLKEVKVLLGQAKTSVNILPPIAGAVSALTGLKTVWSIASKTASIFKKSKRR